jgi:hypothetical protein
VAQGSSNDGVAKSKTSKAAAAVNSSFGTNMPLMSSAFDTAMWLNAA